MIESIITQYGTAAIGLILTVLGYFIKEILSTVKASDKQLVELHKDVAVFKEWAKGEQKMSNAVLTQHEKRLENIENRISEVSRINRRSTSKRTGYEQNS